MNKKGFINADTFSNPFFWFLTAGGWLAVIIGWKMSKGWEGTEAFSIVELILILAVIALASAFFTRD